MNLDGDFYKSRGENQRARMGLFRTGTAFDN